MNWSPPPLLEQPRSKRTLELDSNNDFVYRIIKANFNNTGTTIYYFDHKLKYCKECLKHNAKTPAHLTRVPENKDCLDSKTPPILPTRINDIVIKHGILETSINQLQPGDSISKLITIYSQHVNEKLKQYQAEIAAQNRKARKIKREQDLQQHCDPNQKYSKIKHLPPVQTLNDFITYIEKPTIERTIDNKDPKTFDFVRLYISVNTRCPNQKKFAKKYLKEIKRIALDKIKNCRDYQHYGVPVNYLKLTECTLTHQSQIMFLYELKQTA